MQISKLSRGLFLFVLLLRKSLERARDYCVPAEKEMDTAFSNMKTKLCSSFYLIGSTKVSHFSSQRLLLLVFSFEFSRLKWPKVVPVDYMSNYKYFPGHVTHKFRAIDELRQQMALLSLGRLVWRFSQAGRIGIPKLFDDNFDCQAIHFPKFNQATNKCYGQFQKKWFSTAWTYFFLSWGHAKKAELGVSACEKDFVPNGVAFAAGIMSPPRKT